MRKESSTHANEKSRQPTYCTTDEVGKNYSGYAFSPRSTDTFHNTNINVNIFKKIARLIQVNCRQQTEGLRCSLDMSQEEVYLFWA